MLMLRKKRKERGEVEVYLNNKLHRQVKTMKYLGIIIDKKLTFRENLKQSTDKCRKLIFALSRSAKLNWGLSHKALKHYTREEYSRSSYTEHLFGQKQ